jgi:hypothetical protein
MNHQPFENWLFQDEPLTTEQQVLLHQHLEQCASCRQLSLSWRGISLQLHQVDWVSPKNGFHLRWLERIEKEKARIQRQQSLKFLTFSLGAALFLALCLFLFMLPVFQSPQLYLWASLYRFIPYIQIIDFTRDVFRAVYLGFATGGSLSPLVVLFLLGLASEMAVLGFISLQKISRSSKGQRWSTNPEEK